MGADLSMNPPEDVRSSYERELARWWAMFMEAYQFDNRITKDSMLAAAKIAAKGLDRYQTDGYYDGSIDWGKRVDELRELIRNTALNLT